MRVHATSAWHAALDVLSDRPAPRHAFAGSRPSERLATAHGGGETEPGRVAYLPST